MSATLAGPTALPVRHVEHCMGTAFSIHVPAPGVDRGALLDALSWLHAMDAMFSTYRADSEISRLDTGALRLVDASPEVRQVLDACDRAHRETDGWFDARAGGRLDPSGYVKGWAIQHVADRLAAAGSANHCVNGGGDVACAGRPVAGRGWRIGVTDPRSAGLLLSCVEAAGPVAVATSGPAERGAHVLDPYIGLASSGLASATIVARDLVTADVYATAAVAMGPGRAASWLRARPHVAALLVHADGRAELVGDPSCFDLFPGVGA